MSFFNINAGNKNDISNVGFLNSLTFQWIKTHLLDVSDGIKPNAQWQSDIRRLPDKHGATGQTDRSHLPRHGMLTFITYIAAFFSKSADHLFQWKI